MEAGGTHPSECAAAAQIREQTAAYEKGPVDSSVSPTAVGKKSSIFVERSKTAHSKCKTCEQPIPKGALRCGVEAYSSGHLTTVWAHAECFLKAISVEYCATTRGKCRGSGAPFQQGSLRVGLAVGSHRSWWLPQEAARWTQLVLKEDEGRSELKVSGFEALEQEHHGPLLELLRSGQLPPCELRRKVPAASRSRRSSQPPAAETSAAVAAPSTVAGAVAAVGASEGSGGAATSTFGAGFSVGAGTHELDLDLEGAGSHELDSDLDDEDDGFEMIVGA